MSKATLFTIVQLFIIHFCTAQNLVLEEKKSIVENGFEYGFLVKNEQIKSNKGEEYSRYEISFYVTNKSGCTKLYREQTGILNNDDPNLLATFTCTNANGKRLTSKNGKVDARDFYVSTTINENGKDINKSVKAGYMFRNNEMLKTNIIVLVPKGERPQIECLVNHLQEL